MTSNNVTFIFTWNWFFGNDWYYCNVYLFLRESIAVFLLQYFACTLNVLNLDKIIFSLFVFYLTIILDVLTGFWLFYLKFCSEHMQAQSCSLNAILQSETQL